MERDHIGNILLIAGALEWSHFGLVVMVFVINIRPNLLCHPGHVGTMGQIHIRSQETLVVTSSHARMRMVGVMSFHRTGMGAENRLIPTAHWHRAAERGVEPGATAVAKFIPKPTTRLTEHGLGKVGTALQC